MKTKDYFYNYWKENQQNMKKHKSDPIDNGLIWMQVIFVLIGIVFVSGIFSLIINSSLDW